jgi:hypothetical protein
LRGEIFQISSIDSSLNPPIYSLIDLMKDKVEGKFYREQLVIAKAPDYQKNFFEVEKILAEKTVKGKKFYLVKFLYYSSKFNEYVPAENMKL